MSKPEIHELKHDKMLSHAIINAKDRSVVSWWWLCLPVFIILMLVMKSTFMPGTTLISNMHDLENSQKYMALIFFLIAPFLLIIVNVFSIRKIYFLSGNPKVVYFLESVWFNVLIIALSLLIIVVYSL
jgi:hypothetical protein